MDAQIFNITGTESYRVMVNGLHIATFSSRIKAVEFCNSQKMFYTSDL